VDVSGSDAKIDRAQEALNALASEIGAFIAPAKPYRLVEQFDLHPGEDARGYYRYFVTDIQPTPERWSVVIGEIAHDLRSSLDYLAWGAARRPWRRTQFPIFLSRSSWDAKVAPMVKTASEPFLTVMEEAQPYRNLDTQRDPRLHWLAILSHISNRDKHRLLHTTLLALQGAAPRFTAVRDVTSISGLAIQFGPLEEGTELVRIEIGIDGPNPEMAMDGEFTHDVAFRDTSARGKATIHGEGVGTVLEGIGRYVNKIVRRFEAAATC
jgi:hypothetical protein